MTPVSPRERFLLDKEAAKAHAAMMASTLFERASDAAMLQVQLNLPSAPNSESASANFYRIQGAQLFLGILMTIGDPSIIVHDKPKHDLNYDTAPKP